MEKGLSNRKWWVLFLAVIMVVGISGCGNTSNNKVTKEDKPTTTASAPKQEEKKEEKKEEKVYKLGDTIKINDKYQLTLNKAFLIKERNQFSEKKVEKVAVIEYTYKNLNIDKDLYVSEMNFKVYDEAGNALETYPAGAEKNAQNIAKGKQCTAEMSYGFNKGTKLELHFYDNMFNDKSDAKFIIEVK